MDPAPLVETSLTFLVQQHCNRRKMVLQRLWCHVPLGQAPPPPRGELVQIPQRGSPTAGLRERRNDTSGSSGRSGRQKAATRRNMRREERVTVQGPRKGTTTRRNVTRGVIHLDGNLPSFIPPPPPLTKSFGSAQI